MTIRFEHKSTSRAIDVEDVKFFTTDASCLGVTGFDVHYNDGTFNLFDRREWRLILVKQ